LVSYGGNGEGVVDTLEKSSEVELYAVEVDSEKTKNKMKLKLKKYGDFSEATEKV